MQARLIRQVPMRLLDVSLSGCLVETEHQIPIGTSGVLSVDLMGVPCRYPVCVCRAVGLPAAGSNFRLGAEIRWNDRGKSDVAKRAPKRTGSRGPARILTLDRPWFNG